MFTYQQRFADHRLPLFQAAKRPCVISHLPACLPVLATRTQVSAHRPHCPDKKVQEATCFTVARAWSAICARLTCAGLQHGVLASIPDYSLLPLCAGHKFNGQERRLPHIARRASSVFVMERMSWCGVYTLSIFILCWEA